MVLIHAYKGARAFWNSRGSLRRQTPLPSTRTDRPLEPPSKPYARPPTVVTLLGLGISTNLQSGPPRYERIHIRAITELRPWVLSTNATSTHSAVLLVMDPLVEVFACPVRAHRSNTSGSVLGIIFTTARRRTFRRPALNPHSVSSTTLRQELHTHQLGFPLLWCRLSLILQGTRSIMTV